MKSADRAGLSLLKSIGSGMMLALPAVMAGSFALLLLNIPIPAYTAWLEDFLGGGLKTLLTVIRAVTLDVVSLIMLMTISYSYGRGRMPSRLPILPFVSVCAYLAFMVEADGSFASDIFQNIYLFHAIWIAIAASAAYLALRRCLIRPVERLLRGMDDAVRLAFGSILPVVIVVGGFALVNVLLTRLLGSTSYHLWVSDGLYHLFERLGTNLFSGLVFMLLMHGMWFVGVHGSNILDQVARDFFTLQGGQILSKTFFDTFVVFGGCGTLLCLVMAIFLADRRHNMRTLSRIALAPVLLNINELILFGVPVVLNPVYVIPFLLTPVVLTGISYAVLALGWVPMVTHAVEWTMPIFFSGYLATGSIAGSLLQLVNLAVGTAIYLPFVRWAQRRQARDNAQQLNQLKAVVDERQAQGAPPELMDLAGGAGSMAQLLAGELKYGLEHDQPQLFYQPQVDASGRVVGVEALLRWRYADQFVYPPLVVELAKESGLLHRLCVFTVERAVADLKRLREAGFDDVTVSLNMTPEQFNHPDVLGLLTRALQACQAPAERLGVELTEQVAMTREPAVAEKIAALQRMGVRIIMDDFGMGHSSLTYLQDHHFDEVKLDGNLVKDLLTNPRCQDIIASIISLSQSLGYTVVAEYVETEQQKQRLEQLGCGCYQGYLYSPALPYGQLIDYLAAQARAQSQEEP